jgi:amino acid transporter
VNAQTKTTAKAALIAFALTLISPIGDAVTKGYIEPLDTLNPTNGEIIAHWIGFLGGLPLIVALITVAVTGRKAGLRSSLLNGIGAIIVIPLILLPLIVATAAAFSTNDEYPFMKDGVGRRLFVKQAKSSCAEQLSKASDGSQALIDAFCSCYAGTFADTTTRTEVLRFNAQAVREKGAAIGEKCRQVSQGGQR